MAEEWEQRYLSGDIPWDSGRPSGELQRALAEYAIPPSRVLVAGCGTGTNCIALAERGFTVTGLDLSPTAIGRARQRADQAGVACRFIVADVLDPPPLGEPFPFIFDRGCFHIVRQTDEKATVDALDRWLAPGGWLLLLTGNTHETSEEGPPKVSEAELRHAFAEQFEIRHLRAFRFDTHPDFGARPLAWSTLLIKKGGAG